MLKHFPVILFFSMCSIVQSRLDEDERVEWVKENISNMSAMDILWRLFSTITIVDRSFDISKAAWELIQRDDVYDCSYNVTISGNIPGARKSTALMRALQWLKKQDIVDIPISPDLWASAKSYEAQGDRYDGALHFKYAQQIAADNPMQAYTQTANAVSYYYRAKKKVYMDAIVFAQELAKSNGWHDLRIVLDWTLLELNRALKKVAARKNK